VTGAGELFPVLTAAINNTYETDTTSENAQQTCV